MKRIFVGPKQRAIENNNFFDASITLFGDNIGNNTSWKRQVTFEFWNPNNNFTEISIYNRQILNLTKLTEIMAHNPKIVSQCMLPNNVQQICKNSHSLLETLDDKIQTRLLMKNVVPMLDYYTIKGSDFDYNQLQDISINLVVQLPIGSGGSTTFLCSKKNNEKVKSLLSANENYSISAYQHSNVPYNIHCLIGYDQIELLAPSQQELEVTHKIEYIGSNFNISIPHDVKNKLVQYSTEVCKKIQSMGYRGVLGIDYIYTNDELYFIEINPRFQGSTRQVDFLLKKSQLPSIFDYNYRSFNGKEMPSTKNMEKGLD